jgi:hypothetical protein
MCKLEFKNEACIKHNPGEGGIKTVYLLATQILISIISIQ